ncbi:trigger factor [Mycoplasmopsis edwardii]|uniref:Trigger factor n=1 Tax=Mycoplasmopsis edwardii TaxID=53558 RepID=A0ACD4PHP7_9BACT|nr:trigger factor [Mycoplasmopsis edwardii]WBP84194.1 trigger factor [Mycoplasmopsis edwardii]
MLKHKYDKKSSLVTVELVYKFEDFKARFDKLVQEASSKIKVPGYRPGKAPKDKLLARVDYHAIENKVLNEYLDSKRPEIAKHLMEKEIKYIPMISNIDVKNEKEKDLTIIVTYPTLPVFDDLDFKKVDVKFELPKISKKDVETEMSHVTSHLTQKTEVKDKAEKTKLHDTVNIDFKGFINNEAFEGGEANGYDLELGSNSFIAGFEDQLLDKKVGYKGDVNVKFPANYFVKEYANKEAVFQVKINKIFRQQTVNVSDEMIKSLGIPNVESLKDFEKFTTFKLHLNGLTTKLNAYLDDLAYSAFEKAGMKLNGVFVSSRIDELRKEFEKSLESFGMKKREYLKLVKSTEEKVEEEFKQLAEKQVAIEFVREYMKEGIKTKENEFVALFEKLASAEESKNISDYLSTSISILEKIGKEKESKEVADYIKKSFKI